MQVMDGASFPTSPDNWRKAEVIVNDSDFDKLMAEWGVDPASVAVLQRFQVLSNLAQGLLLRRMYEMGGLDQSEVQVLAGRIKTAREQLQAALQGSPAASS